MMYGVTWRVKGGDRESVVTSHYLSLVLVS